MATEVIVTIVVAVCGSSGIWGVVLYLAQRRHKKLEDAVIKDSAERRMLRGIGHAQIVKLCRHYLDQGYITSEQYRDLREHLYIPYSILGGNGSVEKLMAEIDKLPIRDGAPITPMS